MNIIMDIKQIETYDQVEGFLISIGSADISASSKDEAYRWIAHGLKHFRYKRVKRHPDLRDRATPSLANLWVIFVSD